MTTIPTAAQDPDELFDVVDANGNPLGIVKRRADVHRDGDWHRALHVWVIGENEDGPWIMFQRRSLAKDTWPGELDCTVGGHMGAGETIEDAWREIEEELGIVIEHATLQPIGRRIAINDLPGRYLDRELQDVFLLRDERELLEYHPNREELDSIVRIPLEPLLDLLAGTGARVLATCRYAREARAETLELTAANFITTTDRYFYRAAIAARNALRGDRHVSI